MGDAHFHGGEGIGTGKRGGGLGSERVIRGARVLQLGGGGDGGDPGGILGADTRVMLAEKQGDAGQDGDCRHGIHPDLAERAGQEGEEGHQLAPPGSVLALRPRAAPPDASTAAAPVAQGTASNAPVL